VKIISLFAVEQLSFATQLPPTSVLEPQEQFLMLVQPRNVVDIERDVQSAEQARTAAIEAEKTAQEQRSTATTRLEEKNKAIDENKAKLKAAKKEKKESEILLLTTEAKALGRDKDLLEQREALRDAEIDLARGRNELATLTKQALELERQLSLKRAENAGTSVSGPDTAREARVLIDLEKATLEAQKKVADKQGEVADGAKEVVDRQLKTLEAQQNIYGGD